MCNGIRNIRQSEFCHMAVGRNRGFQQTQVSFRKKISCYEGSSLRRMLDKI